MEAHDARLLENLRLLDAFLERQAVRTVLAARQTRDNRKILSALLLDFLNNLFIEAHAVLGGATVLVGTMVVERRTEHGDQVADGAVNLHAVEPRHLCAPCRLCEVFLALLDLCLRHAANRERHDAAHNLVHRGRAPGRPVHKGNLFAHVIELEDCLHAVIFDGGSKARVTGNLLVFRERLAVLFAFACQLVNEGALYDDHAEAAFGLLGIELERTVGHEPIFVRVQRAHRRHDNAVRHIPRADLPRFEQLRELGFHRNGLLSHLPLHLLLPFDTHSRIKSIIFYFFIHKRKFISLIGFESFL